MEETTKNAWFHKQSNAKKKKKSYFNGFFPCYFGQQKHGNNKTTPWNGYVHIIQCTNSTLFNIQL